MSKGLLRPWLLSMWLALPGLALAQAAVPEAGSSVVEAVPPSVAVAPGPQASSVPWLQHFEDAARLHGVDAHLLQALVKVESNFNPSAVSRAGAVGLMQLMPVTASSVAGLHGSLKSLRLQLQDPATNVHAGALYLRRLMDSFDQRLDLVLAAYNAGAGRVHRAGDRVPANGATPQFVQKVTALYASIKAAAGAAEPAATEPAAFNAVQPASALAQ